MIGFCMVTEKFRKKEDAIEYREKLFNRKHHIDDFDEYDKDDEGSFPFKPKHNKDYGYIITYQEIYEVPLLIIIGYPISIFILVLTAGHKDPLKTPAEEALRYIIYANSIIGIVLIFVTSKDFIAPTILYWCGIITANITCNIEDKSETHK